jgi:hypothetical protein
MVYIPVLVRDDTLPGKVVFEEFPQESIPNAKIAWRKVVTLAIRTNLALQPRVPHGGKIKKWFGFAPSDTTRLEKLRKNVRSLSDAIRTRPVTLVYRPDIVVKKVPDDPSAPLQPLRLKSGKLFSGENVRGFVHKVGIYNERGKRIGQEHCGSGMRVILGKSFIYRPYVECARTIIHELSHKVLNARDHKYGEVALVAWAAANKDKALENADSYSYFYKSNS